MAQTFQYDGLNRLTSATEATNVATPVTQWKQEYSYDQWGNRAVSGFIPNPYATPTALTQYANNQWYGSGVGYDLAGNQSSLPSRTFTYDAENRVIASVQPSMSAIQYVYDGNGRRIQKTVGGEVTQYVYDGSGNLAAEYSNAATANVGTELLMTDPLGSSRAVVSGTGVNGTVVNGTTGKIMERIDYLPFGEEIAAGIGGRSSIYPVGVYPSVTPDIVSQKFTSKERDSETGLDYSQYRYSSAAQGRWMSADPLPGWPADPQSWNRYAYVRNNPLKYVDPLGLSYQICDSDGKCSKEQLTDDQFDKEKKAAQANGEYFKNGSLYHFDGNGNKVNDGSYRQTDVDLNAAASSLLLDLGQRADAQKQFIGLFALGSATVGASGGAFVGFTGLSSGGLTTIATGGEAVGVEGLTADQVALVSRWGRPGLSPGDWVMNGGTGVLTYLMSGKWQPGLGNQFANFGSGQNFLVPKSALQNPGWVENGLGWVKSLLGQRLFQQ